MNVLQEADAKRPVPALEPSRSNPEPIRRRTTTCWSRITGWLMTAAILSSVSGCIPITLKTEKVKPMVTVTDAAKDWNADVGPDVRLQLVSDVRRAILAARRMSISSSPTPCGRNRFMGLSRAALSKGPSRSSAAPNSGATPNLGLRYLIVLGPRVSLKHDSSNDIPFYSAGLERTSLQAVILHWGTVDAKPRLVQSAAQGIEREGWIPGTPLIFTRLYKKVDTDGGALRGLVSGLLDEISADTGDGPIRVVILAAVEEPAARSKP